MRERHTPFSAQMVRPTRERLKTETRRTNGLKKLNVDPDRWVLNRFEGPDHCGRTVAVLWDGVLTSDTYAEEMKIACPYGHPGDVLVVRENFYWKEFVGGLTVAMFEADCVSPKEYKWKPSIHMPRSIARYFLRVEAIGLERLHEIKEGGARREGVQRGFLRRSDQGWTFDEDPVDGTFLDGFKWVWFTINGQDNWRANPWVWVIKFKLLTNYQ